MYVSFIFLVRNVIHKSLSHLELCLCYVMFPSQYKFIVDGEWRHDEHQPFVNGNYGTVNTVLLARESDYIPAISSPQVPSGSSMDVDNDAFQRVVCYCCSELSLINSHL